MVETRRALDDDPRSRDPRSASFAAQLYLALNGVIVVVLWTVSPDVQRWAGGRARRGAARRRCRDAALASARALLQEERAAERDEDQPTRGRTTRSSTTAAATSIWNVDGDP